MCGIVSIFNIQEQTSELRQKALRMSQKIRHRGPDWSGIYCGGSAILAHERLSIVDPESGKQPLFSPDKKQVLAVNGALGKLDVAAAGVVDAERLADAVAAHVLAGGLVGQDQLLNALLKLVRELESVAAKNLYPVVIERIV